ncbi:glucans biosynthesis glucosyltransferase MdoH [Shimia sp. R10_1]|uniref:glucans biosynthesis glucosyltransferase MdoH n=1 Tax=Shimia sp. R10_1 TaxID=2821095 RepID=UPI001ADA3FA0|nr:glucans biosynthesis glucosyltransferase MdoH [Shimia sp. R10_1]MBO9475833.1 glucans biosynthesis glucosyltransferase MdoH [Shimia sp. R10_1]
MDRLVQDHIYMPERAPLAMPSQTFNKVETCRQMETAARASSSFWRIAAFVPTLAITILVCLVFVRYLSQGGVSAIDAAVLALIALSTVWLVFSVTNACLGLVSVAMGSGKIRREGVVSSPSNIALLMPIYNESPWDVFGNASAMMRELAEGPGAERYTLFFLSDTRDPQIADLEEQAFLALRGVSYAKIEIYYRRRRENTDKKVGNIADWIENWGASHDAMVILDADSLMSGKAIRQLARALAADPDAGLIQSRPMLIGAETLFGRVQQFSNSVYGWLIAEGLARWSQHEGNYWGHNAIIRTRAFAESARLPHLRGWGGAKRLLLSHDFVEAGMLRRAGWAVRLLPRMTGSFEETPQTLIDYVVRDRRWCQGNMQHLRILAARGFHVISRFHLLLGALAFLMSPAWLAVITLWAFVSVGQDTPESYFSPTNPFMPIWPEAPMNMAWFYLFFIYGMLLFPKISGAVLFGLNARNRKAYGSGAIFLGSMLIELVLSVVYAPIMMVHHTMATLASLFGRGNNWTPQNRTGAGYTWLQTFRFHWIETVFGIALFAGIFFAGISLLILPIAFSLAMAVPLSKLSSIPVARAPTRVFRLDTPHTLIEPKIVSLARSERVWMKTILTKNSSSQSIAAE